MKFAYFFSVLLLFSCTSTEENAPAIESMQGSVGSAIVDKSVDANEHDLESNRVFYTGRVGTYEQQVVIELGISETSASGRYFYARHQKFLALEGVYDTLTREFDLTESYRGKITGYIHCVQDRDGNLEGTWSKLKNSDKEPFKASLLDLNQGGEQMLKVRFEKYIRSHEILVYNGISNEPAVERVIDEIVVSHLNDSYFSFHYSVVGGNAHLGSIDGIARMTDETYAEYRSPMPECGLTFSFVQDSIVVSEEDNCSYYRGMRAHFGNTLGIIK